MWAQLITRASNWRYVGILVGVWNFIGLILVAFLYKDPAAKYARKRPAKDVLREVDYIGGLLSIFGITCFMMGMQWGAAQVRTYHFPSLSLSSLTCCDSVHLGLRSRSRPIHPRSHPHRRLLYLGTQVRQVPHVS
jgi:hypothetical protein